MFTKHLGLRGTLRTDEVCPVFIGGRRIAGERQGFVHMDDANTRMLRVTVLLVVVSFAVSHLCFWILPNLFVPWNAQAVDQFFLIRSTSEGLQVPYDSTVVHVDLNDASIQELDNFYLNRSHHAQVIRNLDAMGVSAQLYDLIFAARSQEADDRALMGAVASAGHVYFGMAFDLRGREGESLRQPQSEAHTQYLERTKWNVILADDASGLFTGARPLITFPELASASRGLGYLNAQPDRDGVYRRVPLLVRYGDGFYPSVAFRVICDYLKVRPGQVVVRPGDAIVLKGAQRPGGDARDIEIPIDLHGNLIVNYIGPWERMVHYDFADIYRASDDRDELEMWGEELAGKIVVVSEVSTGSSDVGPVPTDTDFPLSGVHANIIHTILTEDFLRELPGSGMLIVEIILLGVILVLPLRFPSLVSSLGSLAVAVAYVVFAAGCFFYGNLIVNIVRPLLAVVFAVISTVTYRYFNEEREKWVLRRSFEAYFPPSIVKKIMASPEIITAVGQRKELTILFSDIKSFSTYSSSMTPEHIQRLLNEYFEAMTDIVFRYGGTLDKFIGDGLMVFFGDPEPQPDHALRSVRAAVDMQKKTRELKGKWVQQGDMPIQIRIGINTGEVAVGNMGSSRRLSYTVLGSDVNLAQRLEANAPVEGIMVSRRTYDLVKDHVETRPLGEIQAKGFEAPVRVYEVLV